MAVMVALLTAPVWSLSRFDTLTRLTVKVSATSGVLSGLISIVMLTSS